MTIQEVKNHYNRNNKGDWFDPETLKFFGSRIYSETFVSHDGTKVYFITSEYTDYINTDRAYSVRVYDTLTFKVSTVGKFLQDATRAQANARAKCIIALIRHNRTEKPLRSTKNELPKTYGKHRKS